MCIKREPPKSQGINHWLHMGLMIFSSMAVIVGAGIYWLIEIQDPWFLLVLPFVFFAVVLFFERFVPAGCPGCGGRLTCRVRSRSRPHSATYEGTRRSDETNAATYDCPRCSFQFPDQRHSSDKWN